MPRPKREHLSPENPFPKTYGYARISKADTALRRLSVEEQEKQMKLGIQAQETKLMKYMTDKGLPTIRVPFFREIGVSGGVPLFDREKGRELRAILTRGDHVVFAKVDRAFRSIHDAWDCVRVFKDIGVRVHFLDICDQDLDLDNSMHEMMFMMAVWAAKWERQRIRDRTREALAAGRAAGRHMSGGSIPYGFRRDLVTGQLIRSNERELMGKILALSRQRWGHIRILNWLNALHCVVERLPGVRKNRNDGRVWHEMLGAYASEERAREELQKCLDQKRDVYYHLGAVVYTGQPWWINRVSIAKRAEIRLQEAEYLKKHREEEAARRERNREQEPTGQGVTT